MSFLLTYFFGSCADACTPDSPSHHQLPSDSYCPWFWDYLKPNPPVSPAGYQVILVSRSTQASKCWCGLWNAYETRFPGQGLENYVAPSEWLMLMNELNGKIESVFPCFACTAASYICCSCCSTATLCLIPTFFMQRSRDDVKVAVHSMNDRLAQRKVVVDLRYNMAASWLEIYIPQCMPGSHLHGHLPSSLVTYQQHQPQQPHQPQMINTYQYPSYGSYQSNSYQAYPTATSMSPHTHTHLHSHLQPQSLTHSQSQSALTLNVMNHNKPHMYDSEYNANQPLNPTQANYAVSMPSSSPVDSEAYHDLPPPYSIQNSLDFDEKNKLFRGRTNIDSDDETPSAPFL